MEAWTDYNYQPLCSGIHWLQYCPAGVLLLFSEDLINHTNNLAEHILDLQVVQINTGILNWFGGGYNTDQQQTAPMDPNTFYVSFG